MEGCGPWVGRAAGDAIAFRIYRSQRIVNGGQFCTRGDQKDGPEHRKARRDRPKTGVKGKRKTAGKGQKHL